MIKAGTLVLYVLNLVYFVTFAETVKVSIIMKVHGL